MSDETKQTKQVRKLTEKEKKKRIFNILLIAGAVLIVLIAVIMILNATGHGFKRSSDAGSELMDGETDVIMYGDPASDSYDFTGDYFDMSTLKGTMTITKNMGSYNITITYSESEDSMTTWTMSATYNNVRKALFYNDCVKTEMIFTNLGEESQSDETLDEILATDNLELTEEEIQKLNEAAENTEPDVVRSEEYNDGSGFIYLAGENIYWKDNKEDMGTGILFQKVEAPEE